MDDINAVIADFKEQKVQIGVYQRRIVELERALDRAIEALEGFYAGDAEDNETLRFLVRVANGGGGR